MNNPKRKIKDMNKNKINKIINNHNINKDIKGVEIIENLKLDPLIKIIIHKILENLMFQEIENIVNKLSLNNIFL